MNKLARSVRLITALMMSLAMLAFACAALADGDPIRVSSLCEPQAVMTEQEVTITIKIYNSSQTDMQEVITLYNPKGNSVEKFNGLKGEQSVAYKGVWQVTSDQIAKGRIDYYIRYTVHDGDGAKESTHTIPVKIKTETASPELSANYTVSPTSARKGQDVKLAYTLSNTGNVELRNIVIANSGVSAEELTAPSLSVGEKITLESAFVMGDREVVSQPVVSYQSAETKEVFKIEDMARRTITIAQDDLEVSLTSEEAKNAYPGQNVAFKVEVKNTGSGSYSDLTIADADGIILASDVSLASGASYSTEFSMVCDASGSMTAIVSGKDSEGNPVNATSETVEISVQDAARALILEAQAQAQTTSIYSEPAVVRFAVQVTNIGQTDASALTITEAGTTVAKIDALPAGESKIVVFDAETSIAGQIQFRVNGKDADGNDRSFASNVIPIVYIAPTPAPTATPRPTAVPPTPSPVPTATPEPTLGERIAAVVDPVYLYAAGGTLLFILILLILVSAVRSAKRKKRMANSIDTFSLSAHMRNYRGEKRRAKRPPKKEEKAAEEIVHASELTPEETKKPERTEQAGEPRRRRAAPAEEPRPQETLRVVPVEERPEFVAQGPVNNSETRIFGRLNNKKETAEPEPAADEKPTEKTKEQPPVQQPKEAAKPTNSPEETIRFNREQVEEVRKGEVKAAKEAKKAEKATEKANGKKTKKKKKGFLFGKRKEEDDDLFDDEFMDDLDEEDDDLFE